MNRAELIGNVGATPEIRAMQAGAKVATFSVATNERWKDRATGEKREAVEWHRVVVWGDGLVGVVEQYVVRGDKIFVAGQIRTRKWTDQAGVERWTTEIVVSGMHGQIELLGGSGGGARRPPPPTGEADYGGSGNGGAGRRSASTPGSAAEPPFDDDIPF